MKTQVVTEGFELNDGEVTFALLQHGALPMLPVIRNIVDVDHGVTDGTFIPDSYCVTNSSRIEIFGNMHPHAGSVESVRAALDLRRRAGRLGKLLGRYQLYADFWFPETDEPPAD